MKQIFTLSVTGLLCLCTSASLAQYNAGVSAKFGIDGDLQSDYFLYTLPISAPGTHDWFKKTGGTGIGLIDTTGTTSLLSQLNSGQNITFNQGMQFPRYSTQDNMLQLDARYVRDYFGLSNSTAQSDFTIFGSGAVNGDDMANWKTASGAVTDKADLLDAYIHMRRSGTTVNTTNPSSLYLIMGASTLANNGDRYLDFELYRNRVSVDLTNKTFNNMGASATGGHPIWAFNADGTLKEVGDMLISFSFSSTTVSDISVWIWVPETTSKNVNPAGFDFVANQFFGNAVNNVKYGYAKITGNPGQVLEMFGSVNNNATLAAPWGTNSKTIGASGTNYFSSSYDAGQFAEVSVNITKLGIDPVFNGNNDPCNPPFTRVIIKTRASASINSVLKDFGGPYEFLDAPLPDAQIDVPEIITCNRPSVSLKPTNYQPNGYYMWSTQDGNIVNQSDPANAIINKGGTYTLTSAVVKGCSETNQTVIVQQDNSAPSVTAQALGTLSASPTTYVQLKGSAAPASSDTRTPAGYTWAWTGPFGFNASTQDSKTNVEGNYQLLVTEQRNGCSALANVTAQKQLIILPIVLINFSGKLANNKTALRWSVASNETGAFFEVQRSGSNAAWQPIATIFTSEQTGMEQYEFAEGAPKQTAYYRLKIVNKDGTFSFSNILSFKTAATDNALILLQNPVQNLLRFTLPSVTAHINGISIYNAAGYVVSSGKINFQNINNTISLPLQANLPVGSYILDVLIDGQHQTATFIKQ